MPRTAQTRWASIHHCLLPWGAQLTSHTGLREGRFDLAWRSLVSSLISVKHFFQWVSEVAGSCRSKFEWGGVDLCFGHGPNRASATDPWAQMDLWSRDFNRGLLCTTSSWEKDIKAAGTEGPSLCSTRPGTFCCLLASSAPEGRTGTLVAASAPHVSQSFHSVSLWSSIRWLHWIDLFLFLCFPGLNRQTVTSWITC